MRYDAFDRDAAVLVKAAAKGVILEGCAHRIYEENARETLSVISNLLGSTNAVP